MPPKPRKHLVIHVRTARLSCENLLILGAALDAVSFALRLEVFAIVLIGKLATCAGLGSLYFARFEEKNPHHETITVPVPGAVKRKPKGSK